MAKSTTFGGRKAGSKHTPGHPSIGVEVKPFLNPGRHETENVPGTTSIRNGGMLILYIGPWQFGCTLW